MATSVSDPLGFNDLPNEVLQMIFTNLTLGDLLLSAARVNSTWRDLICNPCFCPWKKFYYLYKAVLLLVMYAVYSVLILTLMNWTSGV